MNRYVDYIEELEQKWKALFVRNADFYLYGAAANARRMLIMAKRTGVISKIKGCLVSNLKGNPNYCEEIRVMSVDDLTDKQAVILVPHMGRQKADIEQLLREKEFEHIELIHGYYPLVDWKIKEGICDPCMKRAREVEEEIFESKSQEEWEKDLSVHEKITEIMQNQKIGFGGQVPYQSLEKIGMSGVRPSLYRIIKYGLNDILSAECDVLDIGCNVGFIDLSVADRVHSITGVEYDENLVKVADFVKDYMGIDNCLFENQDFDTWYVGNTKKYDIVFSFAIHHWLNLKSEEYISRLDSLLNKGGYICIESHEGEDLLYKQCVEGMCRMEYHILNRDKIKDDGMREREWCLLQKR